MRKTIILPLAAALVLATGSAFAALENSHHDMTIYDGQTQLCFQCHGRSDTNTLSAAELTSYGNVGTLCVSRCHSGSANGILATSPTLVPFTGPYAVYTDYQTATDSSATDTEDVTILAFDGGSHGNIYAMATDTAGGQLPIENSGYPYSGDANIQCSSCHAVHDNSNSPFLWDSYQNFFCTNCHTGRNNVTDLTVAPGGVGNHPVNFVVDYVAAAGRATGGRLGRTILLDTTSPGRYFDVASTNGAALDGTGTSYTLGGKLSAYAVYDGVQSMSCYTCHTVHTASGFNNIVAAPFDQEADSGLGAGNKAMNPICMGCHGGGNSVAANLAYDFTADGNVGVTNFGHAVNNASQLTGGNYVTSIGGFTFDNINTAAARDMGTQNGQVLCSSCHDVHGAKTGTFLLDAAAPDPMCLTCHDGSGFVDQDDLSEAGATPEGVNAHHRTALTGTIDAVDGDTLTLTDPSWTSGSWGTLADGLQCSDCHIGNQTGHNW